MGFTGYRVFNTLYFGRDREPILSSLNARPHYYKYFGPVCNGAEPSAYGNRGGFYAYKSAQTLVDCMRITLHYPYNIHYTWAEIEMYGEVAEHTLGYRSSKLMFNRIFIPRHTYTDAQIKMMSERYACDVIFSDKVTDDVCEWAKLNVNDGIKWGLPRW